MSDIKEVITQVKTKKKIIHDCLHGTLFLRNLNLAEKFPAFHCDLVKLLIKKLGLY